jgi:hypothetical protein
MDEFNSHWSIAINFILTGERYIAFHSVLPTINGEPLQCDKDSNNDMTYRYINVVCFVQYSLLAPFVEYHENRLHEKLFLN